MWLVLLLTWLPGTTAADGGAAKLADGDGFQLFCSQWMQKLAERERANVAGLRFRESEGRVSAEYTGYARKPLRCESRVKGTGKHGVGILVYHEIRYRREGVDAADARSSEPRVVERIEITEVFRYDGARWAY